MKEVDTIYAYLLILSSLLGLLCLCGNLKKWQFFLCSIGILFFAIAIYKKPVETAIKEIVAEQKMKKEKEKLEEIKRLKEIDETNPELTNRLLKKTQALASVELAKGDIVEFNSKQNKIEEVSSYEKINFNSEQIGENIKFENETEILISWKNSVKKLSNFYITYENDKCFLILNFQDNNFFRKIKDGDNEIETKFDVVKAKEALEKIYSGASENEICEVASKKIKL